MPALLYEDPEPPAPILPATCLVGAITWEVERKVNEAIQGVEILPNKLYVPKDLRGIVIHLAHISLVSCHNGVRRECTA